MVYSKKNREFIVAHWYTNSNSILAKTLDQGLGRGHVNCTLPTVIVIPTTSIHLFASLSSSSHGIGQSNKLYGMEIKKVIIMSYLSFTENNYYCPIESWFLWLI